MTLFRQIIICSLFFFTALSHIKAQNSSDIVILEVITSADPNVDLQRTYSVKHLLEVAGLPYQITTDFSVASTAKYIIITRGFDNTNLSTTQEDLLRTFVQNGGILIMPNLKNTNIFDLAGISEELFGNERYLFLPNMSEYPDYFPLFNQDREFSLSLGDALKQSATNTRAYTPTTADVLMRFDDNSAALVKNSFGSGYVYSFGFDFRDLVTRNQMNRDLSAHRSYSNDFEAVTDMLGFIFREIIAEHKIHLVYKHTAIGDKSANLLLSHDVDSRTGMEWMTAFAAEEYRRGIRASFMITTGYLDNAYGSDYYNPYKHLIKPVYDLGHEIGSHSVAHSRDFASFEYGTLGSTAANYYPTIVNGITSGGSVLGELEVSRDLLELEIPSKIRSFRSGHLAFPNTLTNGLSELNYFYNSSNSANDVLSSFPFYPVTDRSFSGVFTQVMEIPVTISDVFDDGFTEENSADKVALWLSVSQKYFDNHMPVVLLIHPNRAFKLTALESYLDDLSDDIYLGNLAEYGDFWRYRSSVNYQSSVTDNVLTISLDDSVGWTNRLSLIINNAESLSDIKVQTVQGAALAFTSKPFSNGKMMVTSTVIDSGQTPVYEPSGTLILPMLGQAEIAIPAAMLWKATDNAASYEIQIGYSPAFDSLSVMLSVTTNQLVLSDFLKDTTQYYWQVRAKFDDVSFSEWSELGSFRTMLRAPEQPIINIEWAAALNDDELRISWLETDRAEVYEFQMGADTAFTEQQVYYTDIINTYIDVNISLIPTNGYWRVRAKNKAGLSEWSDTYSNNDVLTTISENELPTEVDLYQNYPNPFNPTTQISFYLPQSEVVRLEIYNIQGQLISTLASGPHIAGLHNITLNASNYSSGVYLYRLITANRSFVKKMTLIK